MTEQERLQKFAQLLDSLMKQFGIEIKPKLEAKFNGSLGNVEAVVEFTPIHNWTPPQEKPAQADLPEPAQNGAKVPEKA